MNLFLSNKYYYHPPTSTSTVGGLFRLSALICILPAIASGQATNLTVTLGPEINVGAFAPNNEHQYQSDLRTDPMNPDRMVITLKNSSDETATAAFSTVDGGVSWNYKRQTGSGDPDVIFDQRGRAYWTIIDNQNSRKPGVFISDDGGLTWGGRQTMSDASIDHTHTAADRSPSSNFYNTIYLAGVNFSSTPTLSVVRSRDQGATWQTSSRSLSGTAGRGFVHQPWVMRDGTLVISIKPQNNILVDPGGGYGGSQGNIYSVRSIDGGATLEEPVFLANRDYPARGGPGGSRQDSGIVSGMWGSIERLYFAYPFTPANDQPGEIRMCTSDDGGASWSQPRVVSPAPPTGKGYGIPSLMVNPDGIVGLQFFEVTASEEYNVYFSASSDGGATFSAPTRVSSATGKAVPFGQIPRELGGDQIFASAASDGSFRMVWTDNRDYDNRYKIYYRKIMVEPADLTAGNDAPVSLSLIGGNVNDGAPIGSSVGTLRTSDPDVGDTHTYSIVGGATANFQITGNILKTAAILENSHARFYSITIRSTDSGGLFVDRSVDIAVTPAEPIPIPEPTSGLLFKDIFDTADTSNFDGASTGGRLTGTLASAVELKSSMVQQSINGNQLRMFNTSVGSGRLRFHEKGNNTRFNFAAGITGTSITSAGGMRFEFDFTPVDTTGTEWFSFSAGINDSAPPAVEPGMRVNHAGTDFGILFRNNGGTQRFDNGIGVDTGSSAPSLMSHHITIDLIFNSFGDTQSVTAISKVGSVQVDSHTFQWDNNAGVISFEIGTNIAGTKIDNLAISTIPEPTNGLLFEDSFDTADTSNFDGASTGGRLTGTLASDVELKSALAQQSISGNQLRMFNTSVGSGRLRFQETGNNTRFNFAAGTTGTSITSAGGMRFEFDFTPVNTTGTEWFSFSGGINDSAPPAVEPGMRVNHAGTDFGILFRNNGGTQRFDHGTGVGTGSFAPSLMPHHITIDLIFNSFGDTQNVTAISKVGSVQVDSHTFQWDDNAGMIHFEIGTNITGTKIDNLAISTIPEPTVNSVSGLVAAVNNGNQGETAIIADADNVGIYQANSNSSQRSSSSPISGLADGTSYELEPQSAPGKRLEIANSNTDDGANARIRQANGKSSQRWQIQKQTDGTYELIPQYSTNKRLGADRNNHGEKTNVRTRNDDNGADSRWSLKPVGNDYYELIPKHNSSLRAHVQKASSSNLAKVWLLASNNGPAQKWKFIPATVPAAGVVYELEPQCALGKRLDVAGSANQNGANVQIYADLNTSAQGWTFKRLGNGYYSLVPQCATGKQMASSGVDVGSTESNVHIGNDLEGLDAGWKLEAVGNSYYELIPKTNNALRLNVSEAGSENGTNVKLQNDLDNTAQRWKLIPR